MLLSSGHAGKAATEAFARLTYVNDRIIPWDIKFYVLGLSKQGARTPMINPFPPFLVDWWDESSSLWPPKRGKIALVFRVYIKENTMNITRNLCLALLAALTFACSGGDPAPTPSKTMAPKPPAATGTPAPAATGTPAAPATPAPSATP